jgi:hypothetical protein
MLFIYQDWLLDIDMLAKTESVAKYLQVVNELNAIFEHLHLCVFIIMLILYTIMTALIANGWWTEIMALYVNFTL